MSPLRIIFFGTAELACPSLSALAQTPAFEVASVVTQRDRPRGRKLNLQSSSVKILATQKKLPVLQPERARDEGFLQELAQLRPDLIVVAAYGQILPRQILELPRFGCLNVHASLLPKYRGAAPIQWAILNDERETGVTIMKMDEGLDTGDILSQQSTPIGADDDAQTLHRRLGAIGADLLVKTIPDFVADKLLARKQPDEGANYARKLTKEDGRLDWNQPARSVWNRVRAFVPWPGAYTFLSAESKPQLLKIWQAEVAGGNSGLPGEVLEAGKNGIVVACGQQSLRILVLQREGGRRLNAPEFLAGHSLRPGQRLN
ncbi:MAG: methionyl-tRNA formyltransferase [Verrucomicrobia bacterium]|nr:MAG: methionyl-tRNA formyltransferase [Verrucomicrobiota bacterium]